ncbi:MAG: hypothetical protein ACO3NE_09105 [Alphaproteobacteria bacterium]
MLERFCIPATVTLQCKKPSSAEAEQSHDWGKLLAFWLGALFFGMFALSGHSGAQISLEKTSSANSTGSSEIVAQDDVIDWVIELGQGEATLNNVTLTDTFIGDHTFVPGSIQHSGEFDFSEATLAKPTDCFWRRKLSGWNRQLPVLLCRDRCALCKFAGGRRYSPKWRTENYVLGDGRVRHSRP